ncbi:hypothetical protein [Streptomyces sp. NPDC047123]|uniref:hypothetical protein n=1 Tax=Streptomyces sp. NPDC047123 TaxID=3155622 RepID=UPI0033DBD4F0
MHRSRPARNAPADDTASPDPAAQLAAHLADHAAATLRLATAMDRVTAALEATALALSSTQVRRRDDDEQVARLTGLVQRHEEDLRVLLSEANERRKDVLDERGRQAQAVATGLRRLFLGARHVGAAAGGRFSGRGQPDPEQALFVARTLRGLLSPTGHVHDDVARPADWPAADDVAMATLSAEAADLCAAARTAGADFVWHTPLPPEYWTDCPRDGAVAFAVRPGVTARGATLLPALVFTLTPSAPAVPPDPDIRDESDDRPRTGGTTRLGSGLGPSGARVDNG